MAEELLRMICEHGHLTGRGLLSKRVSLNYEGISRPPWLHLNCLDDVKFDFKIHELEFKEWEWVYWHIDAKKNKKFTLEGSVNYFYPKSGLLKGYLKSEGKAQRIGIYITDGRVWKIKPSEEIMEEAANLMFMLTRTMQLDKYFEKAG